MTELSKDPTSNQDGVSGCNIWEHTLELRYEYFYRGCDFDGHPSVGGRTLQQKMVNKETGEIKWEDVPSV